MSTLQTIGIIVGVVSGVSGVVLGIVNYWERRVSTRPRIVVRSHVLWVPGPENDGCIEVCNVGQVPVVGLYAGFQYKTGKYRVNDELHGSNPWYDTVLAPQHVAIVRFNLNRLPEGSEPGRAFAETMVGDTFKASRRDMRRFIKRLKEARLSQPLPAAPQAADTPA